MTACATVWMRAQVRDLPVFSKYGWYVMVFFIMLCYRILDLEHRKSGLFYQEASKHEHDVHTAGPWKDWSEEKVLGEHESQ